MTHRLHAIAGGLALFILSGFWASTLLVEFFGTPTQIATVKTVILYGMAVLIPAMIVVGGSGAALGKGWKLPVIMRKSKRMKILAFNGVLILLPSAIFLAMRAETVQYDLLFYVVQTIELLAGAINIILLGRNMRDGMALRARRLRRTGQ